MLILEGAQAGLSWITILRKREAYRRAFDGFNPEKMAHYPPARVRQLLADPSIVRNRLKIEGRSATRRRFSRYATRRHIAWLWQFVGGRPKLNRWTRMGKSRRARRSQT
jgi:DNA-3-methyladenine glycosylase I